MSFADSCLDMSGGDPRASSVEVLDCNDELAVTAPAVRDASCIAESVSSNSAIGMDMLNDNWRHVSPDGVRS